MDTTGTTFRDYAEKIALALGDGWALYEKPGRDADYYRRLPHLRKGADGPEFYLSNSWAGKGRIHVGCNWPTDAQGQESRPYFSEYSENGAAAPSITFADTRAPEAVAKDIKRRFLPWFEPLWEKEAARVASANDYHVKQAALAAKVVGILGGETRTRDDGSTIVRLGYRQSGVDEVESLNPNSQTVRIKVRDVTLDELAAIQAILAKRPVAVEAE